MTPLIIFTAQYLHLAILAVAAVVWLTLPREDKRKLALTALLAAVIGFALTKVAGALYYNPRPFVADHVVPLIYHAANNGFPSNHTVLAMLVALLVLQVSKRWGIVLVAAALVVGAARVAAGVHSPLDIAGAVIVATVAVLVAREGVGRIWPNGRNIGRAS
ncbi:MAG TPA: phosphatase PAP2 family protein [Candidatus Saccharimonadia bacterium]|nr:phosphatase PAP2 family protein [Candidatus Saccharimonadia bacterium]